MAEQLAFRYGLPAHYTDLDRMLADVRPDVVHITTPPGAHLALASRAAEAGAHVYVEKPLTLRHADSLELVRRVEGARKKLCIGYEYNFDPPAVAMRELVRLGAIGEVVHVESFLGYNLMGAFGAAVLNDPKHWVHALPGKLLHNNVDHLLNKIIEFLPDERPKIHAIGSRRHASTYGDVRDDLVDELRVCLTGARTTAYATFSSHARPIGHWLRVYGTENTLHVDYVTRTVTFDPAVVLPSAIGRLIPPFGQAVQFAREGVRNALRFAQSEFHFFSGMNLLFRRFYESVLEDRPPPVSSRDMLRVSAMMDEIFA
jgi:predicted dehydrogenase